MRLSTLVLFSILSVSVLGSEYIIESPGGHVRVLFSVGGVMEYSVTQDGELLLSPSEISMTLSGGRVFGAGSKLKRHSIRKVSEKIASPVYKRKEIKNEYTEGIFEFREGFRLLFRAYDAGIAYRFESLLRDSFYVLSEVASFNFPLDAHVWSSQVRPTFPELGGDRYWNSFENVYTRNYVSERGLDDLSFTPVLVEGTSGHKVCITESDLLHYPGMYLSRAAAGFGLRGVFAPYPATVLQGGHNALQGIVTSRHPYLAHLPGSTLFPWRVLALSSRDIDLADNDLVYCLASPPPAGVDFSWVKPGKVAWEWWNDWNIYGVDFESGVNNATYRYYIDFASRYGIEYVILDEGWSVNGEADLLRVVPEIDLKGLVEYASSKGVGLILWAGYYAFNKDIEGLCRHYSELGIKGFKVDFMDRDDQPMVEFLLKSAEIASRYHLLLDFHGIYKPTGLHRTYPNVINFEGVHGLEQLKWSDGSVDQVTYDVSIPFIRMLAGPLDYTQGAMRNATRDNFHPVNSEPMSQGTRCHQLAEYVIFESPLNMLCDNPSLYMSEAECLGFITAVPTVWDATVGLSGSVGEYVSIARRSGDVWYVGGLTNWDARDMELDLSFLGAGDYVGELFRDGANASRVARDYKRELIDIPSSRRLPVHLSSGGGFALRITPR